MLCTFNFVLILQAISKNCRHWQELGYLIVYVTGRPDMQKNRIMAWLAAHNFPFGIVSFSDGISPDRMKYKLSFLKYLTTEVNIIDR